MPVSLFVPSPYVRYHHLCDSPLLTQIGWDQMGDLVYQ